MDAADLRRATFYTDDAVQAESVPRRASKDAGKGRVGHNEERGVFGDVRRHLPM